MLTAGIYLPSTTQAGVIRVPEDFPSILAAVDAAASGDSVLVQLGTWTDREARQVQIGSNLLTRVCCAFLKPGISLIGIAGANQTVIDGGPEDKGSVITLLHNLVGSERVVVQGFTIRSGGTAMVVGSPSPIEIHECKVLDCPNDGILIGRAVNQWLSNVIVKDSEFRGCGTPNYFSGTISASSSDEPETDLELWNCRFEANPAAFGAVDLFGGARNVVIDGCSFIDHPGARAMRIVDAHDVRISNSFFLRNSSETASGGAIAMNQCSNVLVEFCTFAYDSSRTNEGGAISIQSSNGDIRNCTFYRSYAMFRSAAVLSAAVAGVFERNVVSECSGGTAVRITGDTFTESCNVFWANSGGDFYGDWTPDPSDIFADPQFCDPENNDWTVNANSPCAPANSGGCGLIGAHEIGCGSISLEATSWGRIKGMYK